MLLEVEESQLLLVDYQVRLMPSIFEHERVLANALRLARLAQALQVPVWGTAQSPDELGPNVPDLQASDWLRPPARKSTVGGNARSLPKHLQKPVAPAEEEGRGTIVIAGCEAHVCLLQTALDLLEDEFDVWVVTDACSSRSERNRDAAFDRLAGNGAELVTTEMVAFEWLRTADHEMFKRVQSLIK
jgi:nicotinamidase-related amidase